MILCCVFFLLYGSCLAMRSQSSHLSDAYAVASYHPMLCDSWFVSPVSGGLAMATLSLVVWVLPAVVATDLALSHFPMHDVTICMMFPVMCC